MVCREGLIGRPLAKRGLDRRPSGGESVRDHFSRVLPALEALDRPTAVVCHGGVIRATYAFAVGWDMTSAAPVALADGHAHVFEVQGRGAVRVRQLNLPLIS